MNKKPIIIVAGEPYSVFLEIFFKSIKKIKYKNPIILIVSKDLLIKQMKKLGYSFQINSIKKDITIFKHLSKTKINIIDVNFNHKKTFDKISSKSNSYIDECFKIGLDLMKKKNCAGLINGPISKRHFLKEKFLGITEYLAKKTNENNFAMLIYNSKLSVSPITTHVPLKKVNRLISKTKIIKKVKLINEFYKKNFNIRPKIGITGLNPHCESNYQSSEEKRIIIPAIKILEKKYRVSGPYAADTIFLKENSKRFDVIVGMYHDQVLTPIKTIYGFKAINITLGLPFVRISPDHGPNSEMLGKNISTPESLSIAINFLSN